MTIIPAIDIIQGKAVRLFKGDYSKMTVYADNALDMALEFQKQGAEYIHLVDLEGARDGKTTNLKTVKSIISSTGVKCEIGGGIRSMETLEEYISIGADRVILGTSAVSDRAFLESAVNKYGSRIAVGADIRNGMICVSGWLEGSGVAIYDFLEYVTALGVKTVICTDISKDGTLSGTNLELYRDLLQKFRDINLIASGGVTDISDIIALKNIGVSGAILGKALYHGTVTLSSALEAAQ